MDSQRARVVKCAGKLLVPFTSFSLGEKNEKEGTLLITNSGSLCTLVKPKYPDSWHRTGGIRNDGSGCLGL